MIMTKKFIVKLEQRPESKAAHLPFAPDFTENYAEISL